MAGELCGLKHPTEGDALAAPLAAGLVVDELFHDFVAFALGVAARLAALVLFGLATVARGDAQVEGRALLRRGGRWGQTRGGRAWEGRSSRGGKETRPCIS